MQIKKQMMKLLAGFMCISLCGCNSILGPKVEYETFSSKKLYDSGSGEMQTEAVEWDKDKELDQELFGKAQETEVSVTDNTELWDAPGQQAFYIPDFHSVRSGDIIDFELVHYDQKKHTVVYAYETLYYGDGDGLDGQSKEGYAPGTHINWSGAKPVKLNVPGQSQVDEKEKKSSSDYVKEPPKTDKEVICLMEYNIETGAYKIHDLRVQAAPARLSYAVSDSSAGSMFSSKSLYATYIADGSYNYGAKGIYVLCVGTHVTFYSNEWLVLEDRELKGSLIPSEYVKLAEQNKKTVDQLWSTSITNFVTDNMGYFYVSVYMKSLSSLSKSQDPSGVDVGNMSEEDAKKATEDANTLESDVRFTRVISFINTKYTKYISENSRLNDQIEAWENSTKSEEEIKEEIPDEYTVFYPEGMRPGEDRMTGIGLCASHWTENGRTYIRSDTQLRTYFRAVNGMYFENVYRAGLSQEKKDAVWDQILPQSVRNRNYFFRLIADSYGQPFEVTGNNLLALLGDQAGVVYYLYDPSKGVDGIMMWKDVENTKISSYTVETETVTRDVDPDSDGEEDGDSDDGDSDVETTANFNKTTTISIKSSEEGARVQVSNKTDQNQIYNQNKTGGVMYYYQDGAKVGIVCSNGATSKDVSQRRIYINDTGRRLYSVSPEGDKDGFQGVLLGDNKIWMFGRDPLDDPTSSDRLDTSDHVKIWSVPYDKILIPNVLASGADKSVAKDSLVSNNLLNDTINGDTFYSNYSIERDGRGFRFTSLSSGIVLYTPPESKESGDGTTYVIDEGQYYASWKNEDGSYTAFGFQDEKEEQEDGTVKVTREFPVATYSDFMKAKVYNIKIDDTMAALNALRSAMKVDQDLKKRFLSSPQAVCEEYGITKVNDKRVAAFIRRIKEAQEGFDSAQRDFWKWATTVVVTQKQKEDMAEKLLLCSTTEELKSLLIDTYSETVLHEKGQEYSPDETDAASSETKSNDSYRNELLEQVRKSQAEQKQKDAVLEGIMERADCLSESQLKTKLQEMLKKIQTQRSVWAD